MFLCNATGNPASEITWMKDEETVTHGDTLSFSALKSDSGKYWCLAENGIGLAINASASLDVQCKFEDNINMLRSHFRTCNLFNWLASFRSHMASSDLLQELSKRLMTEEQSE